MLRHWQAEDLPAYLDLYSRWEVMRWLGPRPRRVVAGMDEARERLTRRRELASGLTAPLGVWATVPRAGIGSAPGLAPLLAPGPVPGPAPVSASGPVGTVLLLPLRDAAGATAEVEVGWHLHPDWQGRGLATEAAMALLSEAAGAGLDRVLALTDPDNTASQAVGRRLAMVDEGLTDRWFGLTTRQFAWAPAAR